MSCQFTDQPLYIRPIDIVITYTTGVNILFYFHFLQQKRFIVPSTPDQARIPFGRVNHNKYMVTDKTAYIGTSNWSGDYFTDTAGVAFVFQTEHNNGFFHNHTINDLRKELQNVFYRDWFSPYAVPLRKLQRNSL